jgi:hypothetical protein
VDLGYPRRFTLCSIPLRSSGTLSSTQSFDEVRRSSTGITFRQEYHAPI